MLPGRRLADLTGYITEGQIFIDRQLHQKQVSDCLGLRVTL